LLRSLEFQLEQSKAGRTPPGAKLRDWLEEELTMKQEYYIDLALAYVQGQINS